MMLLRLFREFFQTGLFAVGGGLATLPFLSRMADTTGWFTHSQLADMVAVSESTPGPIGVNMATYVGFLTAGVPGAVVATLGLVTPSILIILLIAAFLRSFRENRLVEGAFRCLRPASTGLIIASGLSVAAAALLDTASGLPDGKALVLAAMLMAGTRLLPRVKGLHPIVWIGVSALAGILFSFGG